MITIWGRTNSLNVQKVLWVLEELSLPYERIDAGLTYGVNDTAAFKVMNPNGLVPVLKEDDFILWESHAILRYLAARHGRGTLWSGDDRVAAISDQWLDWCSTTVWPNMRPVFQNLVRTPADQRDHQALAAGVKSVAENFLILNNALQNRRYIAGEAFTIADISLALLAFRWYSLVSDRPQTPAVDAWFERVSVREGYRKHGSAPLT